MILYFDTFITDIPLPGRSRDLLKEDIRKKSKSYKMPSRVDIVKYVLASYAVIPWSFVLIRYELDGKKDYKSFDKYIRSLFPEAQIIHKRSDNQKKIKESIKILDNIKDDWIFYAPNNDHPLVSSDPGINLYLNKLIEKAKKLTKRHRYVSIIYSHFSEFINIPLKGNPENFLHGKDTKILENDNLAITYIKQTSDYSSVQIVNKNLLKAWFSSKELQGVRIIRAEDVMNKVKVKNQVIIAPKKEICAHFDGYEHMMGKSNEIFVDKLPPLFIPKGFFENNIKISYGFDDYRNGWVNINPCAKKYVFRDQKNGTDLKITLEEIPYFWKTRISRIDINKSVEDNLLDNCAKATRNYKINPWDIRNQTINVKTLLFWIKYYLFILNIKVRHLLSPIKTNIINI